MALKNFFFGGGRFDSVVADLGLLIGRLGAGLAMAFAHGLGKVQGIEGITGMVAGMGFPAPALFAWLLALTEFVGALFIAVGLMTRPASLALAVAMGVAFFVKHGADPFKAKELAFVYLVLAVVFLLTGAGRFSVDRLINRGK